MWKVIVAVAGTSTSLNHFFGGAVPKAIGDMLSSITTTTPIQKTLPPLLFFISHITDCPQVSNEGLLGSGLYLSLSGPNSMT